MHWSRTGSHPSSAAEFLSLSEPCIPFGELGGNPFWRNAVISEMLRKCLAERAPDIGRLRQSQRDGDAADDEAGSWKCLLQPLHVSMRKSKDRRNQCANQQPATQKVVYGAGQSKASVRPSKDEQKHSKTCAHKVLHLHAD